MWDSILASRSFAAMVSPRDRAAHRTEVHFFPMTGEATGIASYSSKPENIVNPKGDKAILEGCGLESSIRSDFSQEIP